MASYHRAILEAADELERQRAEARAQCDEVNEEYKLLRDAAAAALESLNGGRCPRCGDSTLDHICPDSVPCKACDGKGYSAPVLALRALLKGGGR